MISGVEYFKLKIFLVKHFYFTMSECIHENAKSILSVCFVGNVNILLSHNPPPTGLVRVQPNKSKISPFGAIEASHINPKSQIQESATIT